MGIISTKITKITYHEAVAKIKWNNESVCYIVAFNVVLMMIMILMKKNIL